MTKAEIWATDYLKYLDGSMPDLIDIYGLKAEWGDSVLACLLVRYAQETPPHNICPDCEYRRTERKIRAAILCDTKQEAITRLKKKIKDDAAVAQSVEQSICNRQVGGSNPSSGSKHTSPLYPQVLPSWSISPETPNVFSGPRPPLKCEHKNYDTRTGMCYNCAKTGLPTVPRERRGVRRLVDIIRIALGPKGGTAVPCPIAGDKTDGEFYCTRDRYHSGPCAAVQRPVNQLVLDAYNKYHTAREKRESKITEVGGTPNPCSAGSIPASPATPSHAVCQADGYAGWCDVNDHEWTR
jgi:hypothetical protein